MKLLGSLLLALALAGTALAANPVRGARYEGQTAQKLPISLKAAASGARFATMRFSWRAQGCRLARKGTRGTSTVRSIRVRGGRFAKTATRRAKLPATSTFSGGTQVETLSVRGRLPSSRRVDGSIFVRVRVVNRAGLEIDRCATRKRVKFTARRLVFTEPDVPENQLP